MKKLLTAILCTFLALPATFAFEATVLSTKGKAEILKGSAWQPLTSGTSVSKGDVIQTGFKSEVILKIKGSTVTMDALSRLTVEQLAEKETKDETRLFLDTGSLKSDVKKSENRRVGFTVRSPVATASVRGTVLSTKITYGGTAITTHEGHVIVTKTEIPVATLATEVEDSPEENIAEGEAATQSSGANEKGATSVVAGQSTEVAQNDVAVTSVQTTAAAQAAQTASATITQAAAEAVAQTSAVTTQEAPAAVTEIKGNGANFGTIIISASLPSNL